jgi:hypothetical protein
MDFATVLSKISTGAPIAQAAAPEIEQYGADHVAATHQILQIAGAGVAAESSDKNVQAEAVASAQLASRVVPLVFELFSCFKQGGSAGGSLKAVDSGQWIVVSG